MELKYVVPNMEKTFGNLEFAGEKEVITARDDKKGKYIDNKSNSINIDVKIIDNDKIYTMETLYNGGMENFIQYYNQIKFKCTIIEYHKDTNKVKYMLFEQITQ